MFKKLIFALSSVSSLAFGMGCAVEIEIEDGSVHRFEGDTHNHRFQDKDYFFGIDSEQVVRRDFEITDFFDNN